MIVSTKGRNALKLMMCLAQVDDQAYTPLKVISAQQNISLKYLENITSMLSKKKFVEAASGKGGGYRLTRKPEEYPLGEILRLTEGSLAPVACLEEGAHPCDRAAQCRTLPVWNRLGQLIGDYLDSVTLRDLLKTDE